MGAEPKESYHIERSADLGHVLVRVLFHKAACNAKISDFDGQVIGQQKDVGRFYVTVHDALVVDMLDRLGAEEWNRLRGVCGRVCRGMRWRVWVELFRW